MTEDDMAVVAGLIAEVLLGRCRPQELRSKVEGFASTFQEVKYTFGREEVQKLA
jgi:hypothetical protein